MLSRQRFGNLYHIFFSSLDAIGLSSMPLVDACDCLEDLVVQTIGCADFTGCQQHIPSQFHAFVIDVRTRCELPRDPAGLEL
jgi:hypothetical protein